MMGYMWCIPPLLMATVVLADYYIDNADASIMYSNSTSGPTWQTYSMHTQPLTFSIQNSTGNYTIPVDSSSCYHKNYALGECATADNCFVEVPFIGSGIVVYVLNAGLGGMGANFSVDGGAAVSETIQPPPPPNYQVSQVKMYEIQNLPIGDHTIRMTVINWNGTPTSMKFDYVHVFAVSTVSDPSGTATPTSGSQSPGATASANNSTHDGVIIGATLGGVALLVGLVLVGFFCLRKRKAAAAAAQCQDVSLLDSDIKVTPFTSELNSPVLSSQAHDKSFDLRHKEETTLVTPLTIPYDNVSVSRHSTHGPDHSPRSISSGQSPVSIKPSRRSSKGNGIHTGVTGSHVADIGPSFLDPQNASRLNLNVEQIEVINRLQRDSVPMNTVARIMEGFLSSNVDAGANDEDQQKSLHVMAPPPSYHDTQST